MNEVSLHVNLEDCSPSTGTVVQAGAVQISVDADNERRRPNSVGVGRGRAGRTRYRLEGMEGGHHTRRSDLEDKCAKHRCVGRASLEELQRGGIEVSVTGLNNTLCGWTNGNYGICRRRSLSLERSS